MRRLSSHAKYRCLSVPGLKANSHDGLTTNSLSLNIRRRTFAVSLVTLLWLIPHPRCCSRGSYKFQSAASSKIHSSMIIRKIMPHTICCSLNRIHRNKYMSEQGLGMTESLQFTLYDIS